MTEVADSGTRTSFAVSVGRAAAPKHLRTTKIPTEMLERKKNGRRDSYVYGAQGSTYPGKEGAVPMRAPRRRRRRARHLQPSCPGHLPVPLHSLELHREALHGRRGALLVPHAELGHGRRPLSIILAKNPIWMACQSCLHMRVCIDDSCNAETEPAVGETETHRRVVLRGGGPRGAGAVWWLCCLGACFWPRCPLPPCPAGEG
jgi:hypothetical protein